MKKIAIIQNCLMHYRIPVYRKLAKEYDVTIIHSGDRIMDDNINFKQVIVKKLKLGPFYLQVNLNKVVRKLQPDVVIGMFDVRWLTIMYSMLLHRRKNAKFILWGHRYSKNRFINYIRDLLMKHASSVLLYGDEEVQRIINRGTPKCKLFIAYNTIEIKNSTNFCHELKSSFLFVGRAQKRKMVDVLIKSFATIVPQINDNITLDIVGDGEENVKLKGLCEELGIADRVIFHGAITDEVILAKLFAKSYAYVSPGAVGLGVLHSLAYGVPIVTHKFQKHGPEYYNLTHNENSILYDDHEELPSILKSFIDDKDKSTILGENAFRLYSNERTINIMVDGIKQAILIE